MTDRDPETSPGADGNDDAPAPWREGLPVLTGARVRLREPQLADASDLVTALASPAVARFMSPPPGSVEGFELFIAWIQAERRAGRCFCYALLPTHTSRVAGLIQFRAVEPSFMTAEWGFALEPAHWGTGLFMEGARIAMDFAFRHVLVHRLEARTLAANQRGNAALRKLGAAPEGVLRESFSHASERADQILWGVLADEWLQGLAVPRYRVERLARLPEVARAPAAGAAPRPAWCERLPVRKGRLAALRELEVDDGDGLLPLLLDPEVRRFTQPPATLRAFAHFVTWSRDQRRQGRHACFGIVPAPGGQAVGLIQLRALEPSFQNAEWGFVLGRRYWGTGLFPDAARLALDFAFTEIGVHRLEARTPVANGRACHALQKMGAILEGALRGSFLLAGHYHDDALYSLLASDWQRQRAGAQPSVA